MTQDLMPRLLAKHEHMIFSSAIIRRLGGMLAIAALIAVTNVLIVHSLLHDLNKMAATINIAGKLRMLSQKIAFETSNALSGRSSATTAATAAIGEYDTALTTLLYGGSAFGYHIKALSEPYQEDLDRIRSDWTEYRRDMLATLTAADRANDSESQRNRVGEGAAQLLLNAERLTQQLTTAAQRSQEQALSGIYALLLLDMLLLAALFLLVGKRIVHPIHQLVGRDRTPGKKRGPVHPRYRGFAEIEQLVDAFTHSDQCITSLTARIDQERQGLMHAESMFRGLAENAVVGVYIVQHEKFRYVNAKMADMFGYDIETMMGTIGVFDLVPEVDWPMVESNMRRRLSGEINEVHYERKGRKKDGSVFDVEVFGAAMTLDDGPATIGVLLDISERKKAEATMLFATMVYENSSEAMTITDPRGVILDINPAFTRITGYAREEAVGQPISMLRSGRQDQAFYQAMWQSINARGHWQGEIWNKKKNGEIYAEWLTINSSFDNDGKVHRRIALFSDITQKKETDELVWRQANYDPLTGLPNLLMFRDRLEQEFRKSERSAQSIALLCIGLDRFNEINDTLGHAIGDILLKQAAQRLIGCVRQSNVLARLGGDEFTVFLGGLNAATDVEHVAHHILAKLAEPFVLGDEMAYLSASIGITFYPADGASFDDLLKNADQAMHQAKELGRNRFHYFTPAMQEAAQARRRLAGDLRNALSDNQLRVFYQPIVDLTTGRIVKAEALIRWQHPRRGLIGPAEFIPIAEETGLIAEIGDWIFKQAVRHAARWRVAYDANFQISVNTSPVQYLNGGIRYEEWLNYLKIYSLRGQGIALEITEGLLLEINAVITDQLLKLRGCGIHVALDDFGTGYSSLSYLKKLDIDYLKVDRSFASNLAPGSEDMALYEGIIAMAHKIGLKVVAEGVESQEQLDLLALAGCDFVQGYLFSRPVPADLFERLLQSPLVIPRRSEAGAPTALTDVR